METIHIVIGVILGVPCGIGLALYVVSQALDKSNNFGDSTGTVISYSDTGLIGMNKTDRCNKDTLLDSIQNPVILSHRNDAKNNQPRFIQTAPAQNPDAEMNSEMNSAIDDEIDTFDPSNGSWHQ